MTTAVPDLVEKQFWPTTFFSRMWPDHPAEAPGLIAYCYELRARGVGRIDSGVAPGAKSSAGLYESGFDLFAGDHPGLNRLKAFIGETVQMAAARANGSQVDPRRLRVAVVDSWFHITNGGGFHDAHYHGGCSWCGIYYLRVGDSGRRIDGGAPNGGNRFYSPLRAGGGYKDYGNRYLDFNYMDPPLRDGLLLLFPSYLMHSGLPYRGEVDRVIISFNSQVTLA
jgi:uncharacterized protein (TIGR02466 family)